MQLQAYSHRMSARFCIILVFGLNLFLHIHLGCGIKHTLFVETRLLKSSWRSVIFQEDSVSDKVPYVNINYRHSVTHIHICDFNVLDYREIGADAYIKK